MSIFRNKNVNYFLPHSLSTADMIETYNRAAWKVVIKCINRIISLLHKSYSGRNSEILSIIHVIEFMIITKDASKAVDIKCVDFYF